MLQIILSLLISILAVGCGPRCDDCFTSPIDSTCNKLRVVLLPVIANFEIDGQLNLSEQFTYKIERMLCYWRVYLMRQEEVDQRLYYIGGRVDFNTDYRVLVNNFHEADYLVLVQINAEGSNDKSLEPNSFPYRELQLTATVKVIEAHDINTPRIRVKELHSDAYLVKPTVRWNNGFCPAPGTPLFSKSSFGNAQRNLTLDIVCTIEDLIKEISRF